jgi:uncharacterized protein
VSELEVRDNPAEHRYELTVDGRVAGIATYRLRGDVVVVTHSEVDPEYRGHGYASELARGTLDRLREAGVKVVPMCPFFAKFVSEHHDWDDIVID